MFTFGKLSMEITLLRNITLPFFSLFPKLSFVLNTFHLLLLLREKIKIFTFPVQ